MTPWIVTDRPVRISTARLKSADVGINFFAELHCELSKFETFGQTKSKVKGWEEG
jgi:hypothetical protein